MTLSRCKTLSGLHFTSLPSANVKFLFIVNVNTNKSEYTEAGNGLTDMPREKRIVTVGNDKIHKCHFGWKGWINKLN